MIEKICHFASYFSVLLSLQQRCRRTTKLVIWKQLLSDIFNPSFVSKWVSAPLTNKKRKSHDTLRGVASLIKERQKTTRDKCRFYTFRKVFKLSSKSKNYKYISQYWNNVKMTNSTFPVIHGLEHPLIVGLLYEDPVTTHTVRGVVSESLLHRHAGLISLIKNKSEASAGWDFMRLPLLPIPWNTATQCGIL